MQPVKLLATKPLDGVVLLWLHVRDISAPAARLPDSEVQVSIGDDTVQHWGAINAFQLHSQLFGYLPPERILRSLLRFDVPAWEVPDVWIPSARWRPVTQQHFICLPQDHGHDAMFHGASMLNGPDTHRLANGPSPINCHDGHSWPGSLAPRG